MPQEETDVNTFVPGFGTSSDEVGNPASGDEGNLEGNPAGEKVTQVGNPEDGEGNLEGNLDENEVTQSKSTGTKATKIRVTDIDRLLKYATVTDESPASVLTRVLDEHDALQGSIDDLVSNNEHLQKVNTEIRETLEEEQQRYLAKFDEHVSEIGQLRARITTLENATGTAVVPTGMDSLGIKDVIEEAKDVCGDDETCAKVMGKMIDLKAHFASKAVDHEHAAEQNRLDRDQKELDRKSKEDLAEKERKFKAEQAEKDQNHKIELQLAKKGGFKQEFLEDVTFLGGGSPKRPKKVIAEKKKQAFHEADDEEEYLGPEAEEELMVPEDE